MDRAEIRHAIDAVANQLELIQLNLANICGAREHLEHLSLGNMKEHFDSGTVSMVTDMLLICDNLDEALTLSRDNGLGGLIRVMKAIGSGKMDIEIHGKEID